MVFWTIKTVSSNVSPCGAVVTRLCSTYVWRFRAVGFLSCETKPKITLTYWSLNKMSEIFYRFRQNITDFSKSMSHVYEQAVMWYKYHINETKNCGLCSLRPPPRLSRWQPHTWSVTAKTPRQPSVSMKTPSRWIGHFGLNKTAAVFIR